MLDNNKTFLSSANVLANSEHATASKLKIQERGTKASIYVFDNIKEVGFGFGVNTELMLLARRSAAAASAVLVDKGIPVNGWHV